MSFVKYTQYDSTDCGPTCLRIIAKYYGRSISLNSLREKCFVTKDGVSLLSISDAAEKIGFRTIGVRLTWKQLRDETPLPCIAHWNQNHFIVIYKIKKRHKDWYIYVSDPAEGLLRYRAATFLKSWGTSSSGNNQADKGIVLLLEPTHSFYEQKEEFHEERFTLWRLIPYIRPHRHAFLQVFLSMIVASFLSLCLPFITQSVIDQGVSLGRLGFVRIMLIAQMLIVFGQLANGLIQNWLMLHMTCRVSISLISDFLAKLMRLPIAFFDTKMTGDILQRIQDHDRIQNFLTSSLLSIVMAIVLFLVYGFILGGYNYRILLVFLFGTVLYVGWVLVFLKWRRKLDYMRFQEAANNQSNIVQLVGGMQDIKLNNCERQKRWEWEHIQAKLFKISVKGLRLSQVQQIGGVFIDQMKNVIISFMAAKSVIDGNMTLGMMTALTYIIGQLNAPVSQFVSFVRDSQDASISMERLGEVHDKDDEEPSNSDKITEIPNNADIAFNNVTYQYEGPRSPKVLDSVSFVVPHGKVTAIVGASGSGKTTLMKMMLGFYPPITGLVTIGNVDLRRYSESSWRRQCGCVMQDGFLFSSSIADNIALCDDNPEIDRVRWAAGVANIQDWIESLPLGYNTKIGGDGHGLSIGQKQRILIARAAYKNSPYLFFDEATNSLDANNEKAIMKNLDQLFRDKTVVIIAHRLSTVKNADNIIVLDGGHIVEEGTHSALISKKGYYYELVRNQLDLGN